MVSSYDSENASLFFLFFLIFVIKTFQTTREEADSIHLFLDGGGVEISKMQKKGLEYSATLLQSAICKTNVFHRPSPTLFYFPGLNTRPVWPSDLFPDIVSALKDNHHEILGEYESLVKNRPKSDYEVEDQHNKLHKGSWDWHSYVLKGKRQADFAAHCPKTVSILESFQFPRLLTGTPFSFAFFSTMHGNTNISAHSSPCNLRLRCHFPLRIPKEGDLGMRVADQTLRWKENEPIFFDDCYEHEGEHHSVQETMNYNLLKKIFSLVWNKTSEPRVILLFDLWYVSQAFSLQRFFPKCFR